MVRLNNLLGFWRFNFLAFSLHVSWSLVEPFSLVGSRSRRDGERDESTLLSAVWVEGGC